jgi:deoxyribodipyrimidine photo-lyase
MTAAQGGRPALLWLRRELRLHDNRALAGAVASGRPVVPVFVLDETTAGDWAPGGAARWWLHHSLAALAQALARLGAPLVLRRGRIAEIFAALVAETDAAEIHAGLPGEPWARDAVATLQQRLGIPVHLHRTLTLFDPDALRTQTGGPYGVFTPFARACRARGVPDAPLPPPKRIPTAAPPRSDRLEDWRLLPTRPDWAGGLRQAWQPGEAGGRRQLHAFADAAVQNYHRTRDLPGQDGTSRLSPHLHWGEVSPDTAWQAASRADGGEGVDTWQNEMLWREFSANLLWHNPALPQAPLRREFAAMPWRDAPDELRAWQQGRTGIPIVDAGMRQLWRVGWMHNRVRMIVASFLIKHLLLPWQTGAAWFWDTLVDADLASNSAQWQWVAGCGADAAPYFRIFNPVLQGCKFDKEGAYVRRWVPELARLPDTAIHAPWQAPELVLRAAGIVLGPTYPHPIVDLAAGRQRALAALAVVTQGRT